MVGRRARFLLSATLTSTLLLSLWVWPSAHVFAEPKPNSSRQEIRFYKINKDGITQRLRFTTRKSREAGCHNLLKRARLYRAMQFGYHACQVFSEKNCASDALMAFKRDKEDESVNLLTQGYGWYPLGEHERGEIIRSWRCE